MERNILLVLSLCLIQTVSFAQADPPLMYLNEHGGASQTILAYGPYAFINENRWLIQLDVSIPDKPNVVKSIGLPDIIMDIAPFEVHLVVITEDSGLFLVNGFNDIIPLDVASRLQGFQKARDVQVDNGIAFISDEKGVHIIDITNPTNPTLMNSIQLPHAACATAIEGQKLYVLESAFGVHVYDISQLPKVEKRGSLAIPFYIGGVDKLTVRNNIAFVADFYGNQMLIMDLNQQNNYRILSSYQTFNGGPRQVCLWKNYALLAIPGGEIHAVDISDLNSPQVIASMPTGSSPQDIDIREDKLFIAGTCRNLQVVDLLNFPLLTYVGEYVNSAPCPTDISIVQDTVYIANESGGLSISETDWAGSIQKLGCYRPFGINATAVAGQKGRAYLASQDSVHLLDVHDPLHVNSLASVQVIGDPSPQTHATIHSLRAEDVLLMACGTSGFNMATPTAHAPLDIVGSYNSPIYCRDVAGWQNYVYLADFLTLSVIDRNQNPPWKASTADSGHFFNALSLSNGYAYVAGDGLYIYDLNNPASPMLLGASPDVNLHSSIAIFQNRYVFTVCANSVRVYDVSDPTSPVSVYTLDLGKCYPAKISVYNELLYVASKIWGLLVYQINTENLPPIAPPFVVTHTGDSGPNSLRWAIDYANNHPGQDVISFAIPETDPQYDVQTSVWTIRPHSPLPEIVSDSLVINGPSQSGFLKKDSNPYGPEIEIDGSQAGANVNGFLVTCKQVRFIGLTINRFNKAGIAFRNARECWIGECYIGTDVTGMKRAGNRIGIHVDQQSSNISTMMFNNVRNLISGNGTGIYVENGSKEIYLLENIIGLNRTKTDTLGNSEWGGIVLSNADSNIVVHNEICGNIIGLTLSESSNNIIEGNLIGTDSTMVRQMGNRSDGIALTSGSKPTSHNQIQHNIIGHNDVYGIRVTGQSANENLVSCNLISGNRDGGIRNLDGGNIELAPPTLTLIGADSLFGTAAPQQIIEIYTDDGNQGKIYLGTTLTHSSSNFALSIKGMKVLLNFTALSIDASGNTSEFSAPLAAPVEKENDKVTDYYLAQNYPNPFNPQTTISFGVKASGRVTITIYDVCGREVARPINTHFQPGAYRISFDAKNLANGVYFCRICMNEFEAVKKMVMMR